MLLSHLENYQIILASKSKRRQDLLSGLNIPFGVYPIEVDESFPPELIGMDIPIYLSKKKFQACTSIMNEKTMIITADTIVWYQGQVFGKPRDREEAKSMLITLSGKTHDVITGVTIATFRKQRTFGVASEVRFARISEEEIDYYLDHYDPY
ncbi:MAG TPA: Maf family protein, partial [Paludibacteraceae bacterium]|nr:Maf family protein [Paludibacteraceae bacterium]